MKVDKDFPHIAVWFREEGEVVTVGINGLIPKKLAMEEDVDASKAMMVQIVSRAFDKALTEAIEGVFPGRKQ